MKDTTYTSLIFLNANLYKMIEGEQEIIIFICSVELVDVKIRLIKTVIFAKFAYFLV